MRNDKEALLHFNVISDERGKLVSIEANNSVPFAIARVYYIYETTAPRGFHAHLTLQQVAICLHGSCQIILDDGSTRMEYDMNSPAQGLYIDSMIWREIHDFSVDCVLMVLASAIYNETDYIRDYKTFKEITRQ